MKSLSSLLITSALIAASTTASAALVAGDIALVGFQASGSPNDSFSFASLVNVDAGAVLYFTDNGFSTGASAGFRGVTSGPTPAADNDGNEGLIKYTVGANGLAAGQVVSSLSTNTANGAWTLTGVIDSTATSAYAPLSFSASGEQFTVFQSSNARPMLSGYTSLYNFDNTGVYEAASSSSTGQLAPGLVQGTSAVLLNNTTNSFQNFNFAAFSGQADRATWLARIGNAANWTFAGTTALPVATNVADGSFSVTPVPSPGAVALLGLAGLVARRRR